MLRHVQITGQGVVQIVSIFTEEHLNQKILYNIQITD